MKISHGTRIKEIEESNGYGYATVQMLDSLTRLGYEVNTNDPTADVEIWFDQPHHWKWSPGVYRIGYHPWESTQLLPPSKRTDMLDWKEQMDQCDEIWTPSPIVAKWYKDFMNLRPPVYVYEHGVDPIWSPVVRKVEDKFKFLHVGGEASRKGATEVMKAMRLAFPRSQSDVELNMKIISQGWQIGQIRRINIINGRMGIEELVQLYHDNHAFVYPSWGEGFGLTPLQAMATGMPTITVPGWAPYAEFLDPDISVDSKFWPSQWPTLHPGNMLKPDMDSLVESMRYTYENYPEVEERARAAVDQITSYYSWEKLTKKMFKNLEKRLENSSKLVASEPSA